MSQSYSKRCWFTFPTRSQVEQPIIWQMSRTYPHVSFDIRQASVNNEIGIMAVLLSGPGDDVRAAMDFMRAQGVVVEPIERSMVEGCTRLPEAVCRLASRAGVRAAGGAAGNDSPRPVYQSRYPAPDWARPSETPGPV